MHRGHKLAISATCTIIGLSFTITNAFALPVHAEEEDTSHNWLQESRRKNANKIAHYWQEGRWFALPLSYINDPILDDDLVELLLDKEKMIEYLRKRQNITGYQTDGSYNPNLLDDDQHTGKLNF